MRLGGALLVIGALLSLPGAASAASFTKTQASYMVYTGSANSEVVSVTGNQSSLTISSNEAISGFHPDCFHPGNNPNAITCASVAAAQISLDGGNDTLVNGGTDIGELVSGGEGDDDLTTGGGSYSSLAGDGGDDQLRPGGTVETIRGGADTDTVHYDGYSITVNVSLDDTANDGYDGEQDNVYSDVENVLTGSASDVLVGDAAGNRLDGGGGSDQIEGMGGVDALVGGTGSDTIRARDGVADTVDCGTESDTATIDTIDTVTDCESQNVSAELVDQDRDGSSATVDCDDSNATIHPGATDTPGNGVDEDCDGGDAPVPAADGGAGGGTPPGGVSTMAPPATIETVVASVVARWIVGARTAVKSLAVKPIAAGTTIRVLCSSKKKGCPFKAKMLTPPARARASLTKLFENSRLKPGAVIEIRVMRLGTVGRVFRFTMRAGKLPKRATLCLAPGASTPGACP